MKKNRLSKDLRSVLLSFDLFATEMNLTVKKQKKYSSLAGTLVSLLIMAFCSYTFISMVMDMI